MKRKEKNNTHQRASSVVIREPKTTTLVLISAMTYAGLTAD